MGNQINNIAIIGLGLIGGSIAKAIKSKKNIFISGIDKKEVLEKAESEKVIDESSTDYSSALSADVIFLCLPVDPSHAVFKELFPQLRSDQIITDVCSVKNIFQLESENLMSKGVYIGGHPMTGKEKGGFDNADPLLFENSIYLLSDKQKDHLKFDEFQKLITSLGARISLIDPLIHDSIISKVSHLPQLLSVTLMNAVTNNDREAINFAAGGFRDMTRIASSDFEMWRSIISNNRKFILEEIKSFSAELQKVESYLINEKFDLLKTAFENARISRDEIPKSSKGFLFPLIDVYVFVKDEPGIISKISTALFEQNINIKDIELLKIREGTGGTFRLSFESDSDASEAEIILNKLGFNTKRNQ